MEPLPLPSHGCLPHLIIFHLSLLSLSSRHQSLGSGPTPDPDQPHPATLNVITSVKTLLLNAFPHTDGCWDEHWDPTLPTALAQGVPAGSAQAFRVPFLLSGCGPQEAPADCWATWARSPL